MPITSELRGLEGWPSPATSLDTRFFWHGTAVGELRIQRCTECSALRHPPRPCCPQCLSFDWDFILAAGRGTILSFIVYHHPPMPPFEPPYVTALIQLPEGTRIVGNVLDSDGGDVAIDAEVAVEFVKVRDDLVVPQWRLVSESQGGDR